MDTIKRRRINLRKAIDEAIYTGQFSSDAAFCNYYDLNPSHISQLVKGHGSFGERAARNLEKKIGLEIGFLDQEKASPQKQNLNYEHPQDFYDDLLSPSTRSKKLDDLIKQLEDMERESTLTEREISLLIHTVEIISSKKDSEPNQNNSKHDIFKE